MKNLITGIWWLFVVAGVTIILGDEALAALISLSGTLITVVGLTLFAVGMFLELVRYTERSRILFYCTRCNTYLGSGNRFSYPCPNCESNIVRVEKD